MTGPSLARRLGTADAVVIGLGAMLGAGVFAALAPAAAAAGSLLLAGLAITAVVATCNALAPIAPISTRDTATSGTWWTSTSGTRIATKTAVPRRRAAAALGACRCPGSWPLPLLRLSAIFLFAIGRPRGPGSSRRSSREL
jgi:APA family basic amino acid/polyamine antiporter